jgi:hypothetical protein
MKTIFNNWQKKLRPFTLIAKAIKADRVIGYIEIILLRQPVLGLTDELQLVIKKLRIIDDRLAAQAYQVMMVLLPVGIIHQLVPGLAVSEIELLDNAHLSQHVQGAIHRSEAYGRVHRMRLDIHVGRAHVIFGFMEYIDNHLPRRRDARPDIMKPVLPPRSPSVSLASHSFLAFLNENDFHYQYNKNILCRQLFNE